MRIMKNKSCAFILEDIVAAEATHRSDKEIAFGLIFFSSSEAPFGGEKYRMVIESAKFADQHGFSSVWIPERHFTKDGWLYPNPAVLQAALARETQQIGLRAGSVVIPLHNPLRVAEEWAMVDNLSGGRVGISFASGWHPNDFALMPENYARRNEAMFQGIETVRKLWRGEAVQVKSGDGSTIELRTYPTPVQPELPIWVTAAGNPKTFVGAGESGAHLLTHLYNHTIDELAEKIRLYREARAQHGYDPNTGQVSVMIHTFVSEDAATLAHARAAFCEYLKSASYLLNAIATSRGQKVDFSTLSEQDISDYLAFVYERLASTQRVLFGTPQEGIEVVRRLQAAGVNEIACQMDFGIDVEAVLQSMPYLNQLKELSNATMQSDVFASLSALQNDNADTYHSNGTGNGTIAEAINRSLPPRDTGDNLRDAVPTHNTLAAIQQRCGQKVDVDAFYNRLQAHGIQLAGNFRSITHLWRHDGEALGEIQLHDAPTHSAYQLPPTLLDSCFQVLIAALPGGVDADDALYLPVGLRSFRLHHKPTQHVWSHAIVQSGTTRDSEQIEGDVRVLDAQGQLLVEASGLRLQRSTPPVQPVRDTLDDLLYELSWEVKHLEQNISPATGTWLIFMDSHGVGQRLAELLTQQGNNCIKVFSGYTYRTIRKGEQYSINPAQPEQFQRVLQDALTTTTTPVRGILHLWSLDTTAITETSMATLENDQLLSVGSALHLIQALATTQGAMQPRLWFVTSDVQAIGNTHSLSVAQSPLWGLGRTCAIEHPELWGGLIDIEAQATAETSATQLLSAIAQSSNEDQIAFRQGQSYVARLVRSDVTPQRPLAIQAEVSYLITGGLWGLGFEVARWLARQGARHLILLGRTQLPPRTAWDTINGDSRLARQIASLRELEAMGVEVRYAAIDVTDEVQLTAFLHAEQQRRPIRGVMHAASVWQDEQGQSLVRPLINLNVAALQTVFRPKVLGSWLLSQIFQGATLDFFVSFSSGASLFGSAAQGNYAAAGAFLDTLAQHMHAHGQPALSIDWGAVSETGFGATADGLRVHEYWEAHGIQRITPKQVLAALALLIPQQVAQVGVLKLDWQLLQDFYPQLGTLPLLTYMLASTTKPQSQNGIVKQAEHELLQQLSTGSDATRAELLETYLAEKVAGVLRLPIARIDVEQPLTALGLDSLMAIELKNRIELELAVHIPIVAFLQGPSIRQFVAQLRDQLPRKATVSHNGHSGDGNTDAINRSLSDLHNGNGVNGNTQNTSSPLDTVDAEQLLAQLDQFSDDEVEALLNQMVQEEGSL